MYSIPKRFASSVSYIKEMATQGVGGLEKYAEDLIDERDDFENEAIATLKREVKQQITNVKMM